MTRSTPWALSRRMNSSIGRVECPIVRTGSGGIVLSATEAISEQTLAGDPELSEDVPPTATRFRRRGQSRPEARARRRDPHGVSRPALLPTGRRRTVRGSQHPRTRRPPHSGRLRAPFRPKSMGLPIRCDIDDPDISRECERRAKRAHASKTIVSYQNNVQAFKLKERTSTTSLGDVHRLVWT